MTQVVGPVCSGISSLACFSTVSSIALVLFIFKRKSKALFRLEIGLCIALGAAHLANFFIALPDLLPPQHLSYQIFYIFRVVTLGAAIHYLVAIYIMFFLTTVAFLLSTLRWSEERIKKTEKWLHTMVWLLCVTNLAVYINACSQNKISAKKELMISLAFLCAEGSFIVVCCIAVNINELLSPLVTARSKKNLESFLRRLSILTVVSCLVFLQVLLFIPAIRNSVDSATGTTHVSEIFLLDGLLVSIILATTPHLMDQYPLYLFFHTLIQEVIQPMAQQL